MYLIGFVFMCWKKKKKIKLMGKNYETAPVKCVFLWWRAKLLTNKHARPLALSSPRACLPVTLPPPPSSPHFHTYSRSKVQSLACEHTHARRRCWPLCSVGYCSCWTSKNTSQASPSVPSSSEAAPTPRPLQHHHDGTNIPVEIWVITSWPSH